MKIAEVVVDVPIKRSFYYEVPEDLLEKVEVGKRVIVPFGKKDLLRTGIVTGIRDEKVDLDVKSLFDVPDAFPVFTTETLELAKVIAERYASSLGEVLFTFLPKELVLFETTVVKLIGEGNFKLTELERKVVSFLKEKRKGVKLSQLSKTFGSSVYRAVNSLESKGIVSKYEQLKDGKLPKTKFIRLLKRVTPKGNRARELVSLLEKRDFEVSELLHMGFSRSTIKTLLNKEVICVYEKISPAELKAQSLKDNKKVELTALQKEVFDEIVKSCQKTFLLYGVTGSGKMEVYLKAAEHFVKQGKSVLILVPELLLTPELRARVESYFGKEIGVYHGKLSGREKVSIWLKALKGELKVVLGTRISVMLPMKNLGLIVVDEEQDVSYKEQQKPYYNARDMAIKRGEIEECSVVLVSATPSVESYYKATTGEFALLRLNQRVTSYPLPYVKVIDLKKEKRVSIFSKKLLDSIENTVKKGEQVLLFVNRRGFFSSAFCPKCGFIPECKDCAVPLTYHKSRRKMICHICGKRYNPIYRCPTCKVKLEFKGYGTERVEEEIRHLFPELRVVRLDQDTVRSQKKAADIIKEIKEGKYDVIVGTQIASKGHNFPNLTLVAILMADISAEVDFRRSERVFQLIVNTTGRAGRFRYGAAIVQAFNPDLPSIKYAANYEFDKFYREEIQSRQIFNYPPFSYPILVEFLLGNKDSFQKLEKKFQNLKERLKGILNVPLLSPAPIPKVSGKYRFLSFMRASSEEKLIEGVKILSEELQKKFRGIRYKIDVEPINIT